MKKRMKRVVALFLAVCLCIPFTGMSAKAATGINEWVKIFDSNTAATNPWENAPTEKLTGNGNDDGTYRVSTATAPWNATMTAADTLTGDVCLGMQIDIPVNPGSQYRVEYTLTGNWTNLKNDNTSGSYFNFSTWTTANYSGGRVQNKASNNQVKSLDGSVEKTFDIVPGAGEIALRMSWILRKVGASEYVTVSDVAVYEYQTNQVYDVTIDGEAYTAKYNSKITLTASETKGNQVFSHWSKNGNVASYDTEYTYYANGDDVIEAVYADEAPTKEGIAIVTYEKVDDELIMYAEFTVPEGYTDGRFIASPTVNGSVPSTYKYDSGKTLSGRNQYKVVLGGINNFNAESFTSLRLKLEFVYNGTGNQGFRNGLNLWFVDPNNTTGSNAIQLGNPQNITSGSIADTF